MKKEVSANDAWRGVTGETKKSILGMIVEDSESKEPQLPDNEKLKALSEALIKMKKLESKITELSNELKIYTDIYNLIRSVTIPDIFDELGMRSFTLSDGTKAWVDRSFAASISKKNEEAAFNWLSENGHDGIIKHDVVVKVKGEEELHRQIIAGLKKLEADYEDKQYIHPQSLKAFVREQMEKGSDIPQDVFGVFPVRVAKIISK
jgi:glutamyl/glutaminyl-tRNA synthetase